MTAQERPAVTQERPAPAGDLIGKSWQTSFVIDRLVGAGGMGEVWAASSRQIPGRLAVKVISFEFTSHREALERFFGEARAASALDDPNVIKIYDAGQLADGRPALIMEYIDGPSLQGMIERVGALSVDTLGRILIQVASALRVAHAARITHRDIKPSNILVTSKWGREHFAVLADFGIAKLHDPHLAGKIRTRTNVFIGTPAFAAPEQALGKPVDDKADVYALGVVLYYGATGRTPYEHEAQSELGLLKLQTDGAPYPELRTLRPDVPPAWNALVRDALALDPRRRPTAVEFAKRIADGMPNGASLLLTLAPHIAVHRGRFAAGAATLSSDVPTALAQLEQAQAARPARPSRAILALALAGPILGSLATIAVTRFAGRGGGGAPVAVSATGSATGPASAGAALVAPEVAPAPPDGPAALAVDAGAVAADGATPIAIAAPPDAGAEAPTPAQGGAKAVRARGSISIKSAPFFADVYIDGVFLRTTPVETTLPAGRHRVRLVNEAHGRDETRVIVVSPDKPVVINKSW